MCHRPINHSKTTLQAKGKGDGTTSALKSILSKLLGDSNKEKMEQAENIRNKAIDFNSYNVAPEELQRLMWHVLEWRDAIYREILKKIEMVPGLSELIDEWSDTLNACEPSRSSHSCTTHRHNAESVVFTVLEPLLKVRPNRCCTGFVNSSDPSQ